uniref:Coleoptericin C n=1 Tax=Tenebrio molitor TaxID=7067 RepID=A0A076G2A9_TENMO|nr:coleoptericin C [Tenebrio molitor]
MNQISCLFVLVAAAAAGSANRYDPEEVYEMYSPVEEVSEHQRLRRSSNSNQTNQEDQNRPWVFNPNIGGDENGNVKTTIEIKRKGEDADFNAGWGRVVDGPNKGESTWHVGGTINWGD